MTIISCKYFALTKAGSFHPQNEDRVFVGGKILSSGTVSGECSERIIAIVCDGIGGEPHGELAASIAIDGFRSIRDNLLSPYTIAEIILSANKNIRVLQQKNYEYEGMSTTIAGISIERDSFLAFNAGDTRIYLYYNGELRQISTDHTKVSRRILRRCDREGEEYVEQSVVPHYLGGIGNSWFPSLQWGRMESSPALFLLCSDGVYKNLEDSDFQEILNQCISIEEKCQAIMNRAVHNGSTDDMSITLLEVIDG